MPASKIVATHVRAKQGIAFIQHVGKLMVKDGEVMPMPLIALGLCGEAGELLTCRCGKNEEYLHELGDVLWYATAMSIVYGRHFDCLEAYQPEGSLAWDWRLVIEACAIADMVKKHVWHGKELPEDFDCRLGNVVHYIDRAAAQVGYSLEEVIDANIAKLKHRYPNGFVEGGGVR